MGEAILRAEFERRKPYLQKYGEWIRDIICNELNKEIGTNADDDKFLKIPPTPRVKNTDSFLEKVVRKQKANPLDEITDQVGVRFVVLLLKHINIIEKIIKNGPWCCQKDRDFEQEKLDKPDYFSYQSDHYIIKLKKELEIDGIIIPVNTACEIQIRTLLQHAYAEMSHDIDYKPSFKLPSEDKKIIRRALAKGSALIESTDDVFDDIKESIDKFDDNINKLLLESANIYTSITDNCVPTHTPIGLIISDTYRELLNEISIDNLRDWAKNNSQILCTLKIKRNDSIFYRDAIIILLCYMISNNQTRIPIKWPLEINYLEEIYQFIGISSEGLF